MFSYEHTRGSLKMGAAYSFKVCWAVCWYGWQGGSVGLVHQTRGTLKLLKRLGEGRWGVSHMP